MEVAKRIASQKVLWTPSQAIVHASQGAHDGNSIISESALNLDRQRKFQSKKIGGSFQSKKRIASTIVLSSPAVAKSKSSPAVAKGLRSPAAAMQILKAG